MAPRDDRYTGVIYHAGRTQPWTAWHEGYVVRFTGDRKGAHATIQRLERDGVPVSHVTRWRRRKRGQDA